MFLASHGRSSGFLDRLPPVARGPWLRIVSVNDVYSLENLPRLRTLVEASRAGTAPPHPTAPDVLLVTLVGDFLAPSTLSSIDGGAAMIDCMNRVPITHAALGNHEDDVRPEELRARVGEFAGTWLATNVIGLHPKTVPSQILSVGAAPRPEGGTDGVDQAGGATRPVRVGLIGVVMDDARDYRDVPFEGATVLPCNETARRATRHLIDVERCDAVVALTHQSIANDRLLAASDEAARVPVILGGHEHVPFDETVGATRILKAGTDATHAWIVDLQWEDSGSLPRVEARLEPLAGHADDAALRARVDEHMRLVAGLEDAVLLHLAAGRTLSSVGSRRAQTSLGALVCSRLRDALVADVAILNGGAIRGGRSYEGRFTYADLQGEVPFENEMVVVAMPGRVLDEAVAFSRSRGESGGFLQVDDAVAIEGGRLRSIRGVPFDPERPYKVAVVRNLLDGMDHIEPLVAWARTAVVPAIGSGRGVKILLVEAFSRSLLEELGGIQALDKDRDGSVAPSEIAAALTAITCEPASPITVDLLMRALR